MRKKLTIAAGTTYSPKIECLKNVLDEIGINANVIPVKVESGVSEQPLSEKETLTGSINRAKEAIKKISKADVSFGIEVGYHPNQEGKYEIFCCTTIVDRKNVIISSISSRLLLPEFHQKVIKEGKYLSDYVRKYKKNSKNQTIID